MNHASLIQRIRDEVRRAVIGLERPLNFVLTALFARGHVLLEDVPGVGKTILAQAIARAIDGSFRRIQFTSDMLPSDILGVHIWRPDRHVFEFREGPIFANIVLADEINRANPKTQSALLEVMTEGQVSLDHKVYPLPQPFFIIATQNPVEYHGTFPLPESQKDRFLMTVHLGYPDEEEEKQILLTPSPHHLIERVRPVVSLEDIRSIQEAVDLVVVHPDLLQYTLTLARETRKHPDVLLGASPRAGKHLIQAARAFALIQGRQYVIPEDIKQLCIPVWAHRLIPRIPPGGPLIEWATEFLQDLLHRIPVPA